MATLDTYSKTTWINNNTPINASNMNNIEEGVFNNRVQISTNEDNISGVDARLTTAEGDIDTLQLGMSTAQTDINNLKAQNGSATLNTTAQTLSGAINELDAIVGSATLDTVSQTVTGAVNELNTSVGTLESVVGSTTMTTTAQTVTGAVNELNTKRSPVVSASTLAHGTWSNGQYSFESTYPVASYRLEIELDGDNITESQMTAWTNAKVIGSATANKIYAKGTVPTVDIPIILMVWTL